MKAKNKIVAIVPAAGLGKRFAQGKNKPLYELSGKPLIIRTLETLQNVEEIDEIIPVLKKGDVATISELIKKYNISKVKKIAPGGKERQDSVYNAIKALDEKTSIVVIHDGARPFAGSALIKRTIRELLPPFNSPLSKGGYRGVRGGEGGFDGVVAGVPVKDTIKEVRSQKLPPHPPLAKGGRRGGGGKSEGEEIIVTKTLTRSSLWAIQTPQAFYFRKIKKAHEKAGSEGFYATDDAALIERYGGRVKIITGSYDNIKITTPEDIKIAEAILAHS